MMTEKEMGILEDARFETMWDVAKDHDGTLRYGHKSPVIAAESQSLTLRAH
jgi:hypothetical protein